MDTELIIKLIISVLSGIAVCIPLVIKLVQTVKESVKEKNWSSVLQLVMNLMKEAEKNYQDGASKKDYVLSSLHAVADTLNFNIDYTIIGEMIDAMCDMAKSVN